MLIHVNAKTTEVEVVQSCSQDALYTREVVIDAYNNSIPPVTDGYQSMCFRLGIGRSPYL
jgi:hypothetical protein